MLIVLTEENFFTRVIMECCKNTAISIRDELVLSLLDDFKLRFPHMSHVCNVSEDKNVFNKILCDLNSIKLKSLETNYESKVNSQTYFLNGLPLWLVCIISLVVFVLPLVIYISLKRINYNIKSNCTNRQN